MSEMDGKNLSEPQIAALRLIAKAEPVGWMDLWRRKKYGHIWTVGSLANRGLIADRHYLCDGADYEVWELSETGRVAIHRAGESE
jgi:hypothetical protein